MFEKTQSFKYLGVKITNNNDWNAEIASRILKAERAFFAMIKYFKSKLFSRDTKILMYIVHVYYKTNINLFGCKVCPMTV